MCVVASVDAGTAVSDKSSITSISLVGTKSASCKSVREKIGLLRQTVNVDFASSGDAGMRILPHITRVLTFKQ